MTDTTIKVDSAVRDRLAMVAAERGVTMRSLIEEFAESLLTHHELRERQIKAIDYVRTHLRPDFSDEDLVEGEKLWATIAEMQKSPPAGILSAE